jgi:hypothetical protein
MISFLFANLGEGGGWGVASFCFACLGVVASQRDVTNSFHFVYVGRWDVLFLFALEGGMLFSYVHRTCREAMTLTGDGAMARTAGIQCNQMGWGEVRVGWAGGSFVPAQPMGWVRGLALALWWSWLYGFGFGFFGLAFAPDHACCCLL